MRLDFNKCQGKYDDLSERKTFYTWNFFLLKPVNHMIHSILTRVIKRGLEHPTIKDSLENYNENLKTMILADVHQIQVPRVTQDRVHCEVLYGRKKIQDYWLLGCYCS